MAVVDDDPEIRAGLQGQLELWGFEVVTGADHVGLLDQLEGKRPDILLVDFQLAAGLTGIEALTHVKEALGGDIPSVVLTGDTTDEHTSEAQRCGCHVLHKPIAAGSLREALQTLSVASREARGASGGCAGGT